MHSAAVLLFAAAPRLAQGLTEEFVEVSDRAALLRTGLAADAGGLDSAPGGGRRPPPAPKNCKLGLEKVEQPCSKQCDVESYKVKYREVEQEAVGRGKRCEDVASELDQGEDGNVWVRKGDRYVLEEHCKPIPCKKNCRLSEWSAWTPIPHNLPDLNEPQWQEHRGEWRNGESEWADDDNEAEKAICCCQRNPASHHNGYRPSTCRYAQRQKRSAWERITKKKYTPCSEIMSSTDYFRVGSFACERLNQGMEKRTRKVVARADTGGLPCDPLREQVCEVQREDNWHDGYIDLSTCKAEAEDASIAKDAGGGAKHSSGRRNNAGNYAASASNNDDVLDDLPLFAPGALGIVSLCLLFC